MERRVLARSIAEHILDRDLNREQTVGVIDAALRKRDERAAQIVENSDLTCLIPSEIADKIRKDDGDAF